MLCAGSIGAVPPSTRPKSPRGWGPAHRAIGGPGVRPSLGRRPLSARRTLPYRPGYVPLAGVVARNLSRPTLVRSGSLGTHLGAGIQLPPVTAVPPRVRAARALVREHNTSDGVDLGDLLHDREARVDAEDRRGLVGHISCSESGAVLPSLPRIVFRKWWLRRALGGATSFFCPSEIHLLGWM